MSLADTIITEKIFTSEAFNGAYGQGTGSQVISGDADATAAVMMALGDYCNRTSLLGNYVFNISDQNKVKNDLNAISIPKDITEDIILPSQGIFGSTLTWTSSNEAVITADGKITRSEVDIPVALTVTAVNGTASDTKKFVPVVKAEMDADTYAVETALSEADVIFEAIENISIPSTTVDGVSFSWSSSDSNVLDINGTVTRPALGQPDKEIILTLTASKGNAAGTKEFKVMVYSYKDTTTDEGRIKEGNYKARNYYLKNRTLKGYWNVWAAYSALGEYIQNPKNGYVYDTTGNSDEQPGAHILALIAMGENPYDYGGNNYVEAMMKKSLTGAWSVPVFNALALEAAGISSNNDISQAVNGAISHLTNLSMGPDIGGWAAVVASRHLEDEKYKDNITSSLKVFYDTLAEDMSSGSMGSKALSYGCVVTGFTALTASGLPGYDVTKDEIWINNNPIKIMYEGFFSGEAGVDPAYNVQYRMEFTDLYNTLYNNGNVGWITCGVSKDKLEAQKVKAQEILNNSFKYEASSINAINDAIDLANTISQDRLDAKIADFGQEYYTLYDAVRYAQLSGEDSDEDIAKEINDYINSLPSVENLKLSDEADVSMARNAFNALNTRQQGMVSEGAKEKLTALEAQIIVLKRLGLEISGGDTDFNQKYIRDNYTLTVNKIEQGSEIYNTVQNKIKEAQENIASGQSVTGISEEIAKILSIGHLLSLYDLTVYDSFLGENVEEPVGGLQFSVPIPEGSTYDSYLIVHMKQDGSLEYIVPQLVDGKLVFSLDTLSPVGVIGYNAADLQDIDGQSGTQDTLKAATTGDKSMTGMYVFLSFASLFALSAGYVVRKRKLQYK